MSKSENSVSAMVKLGLVLAVYAAVSCAVLAVVNNFTSPKIEANQKAKIEKGMKSFFPEEGITFEKQDKFDPASTGTIKIESVILAKNVDGTVAGGAVQVSGPTYDQSTILVGIDVSGKVRGLQFLKLTDSPGFGLKANDSTFKLANGQTFYGQFEGKDAKLGFKINETFDAISGATITSNGVANLLNEGSASLLKCFKENENE